LTGAGVTLRRGLCTQVFPSRGLIQSGFTGDTSAYFYQLSAPISWDDYGHDTDVDVSEEYRMFLAESDGEEHFTSKLYQL